MTPCFSLIRNSYSDQFPIETIPQNATRYSNIIM